MKEGVVLAGQVPDLDLFGRREKPRRDFFDIQVVADKLHINPNSPPPIEGEQNEPITVRKIELQIAGWNGKAGLPVG